MEKNKIRPMQILTAISEYPVGIWGSDDKIGMAKLVFCAHMMGREYGMDAQLIKQATIDALGGVWKISKLPPLYQALNILGVREDWFQDYNAVQMWRESRQYEILRLENMLKELYGF